MAVMSANSWISISVQWHCVRVTIRMMRSRFAMGGHFSLFLLSIFLSVLLWLFLKAKLRLGIYLTGTLLSLLCWQRGTE